MTTVNKVKINEMNFATHVCQLLESLGVEFVFGVSGGAISHFWESCENSETIRFIHCRHESGAAFAATEAYFASGHPTAVMTTTGPGITNAITGLFAARVEGAKVLLISGHTSVAKRGRYALQEAVEYCNDFYASNALFDYAQIVESVTMLPMIAQKLTAGFNSPGSFVAHLSIPIDIQSTVIPANRFEPSKTIPDPIIIDEERIKAIAQKLSKEPFAIWIGFGAKEAADEIKMLAELSGAGVMCTPRGKGIFPETNPQFVGVTGVGGHDSVYTYLQTVKPMVSLVLGSRLSEISSFWDMNLVPQKGLIHVDINPTVPGSVLPQAKTVAIQADIKAFLKILLKHFPKKNNTVANFPKLQIDYPDPLMNTSPISPVSLLNAIQKIIVKGSKAIVMADAGNSYTWATHLLRFDEPHRFRVSSCWGSMGHFVTGVIGAAIATKQKAVAIVGDGAMLMNNEINTAVKYNIPAVWIVLNDAAYNMCEQGEKSRFKIAANIKFVDTRFPRIDFVAFARSQGADGIRVEKTVDIESALSKALASKVPFIIDVIIDVNVPAPIVKRLQTLVSQEMKR